MRKIKRAIIWLLVLLILVSVINSKTDFFLNIAKYVPSLADNAIVVGASEDFSLSLSSITDRIPSFSQIMAYIKGVELPIEPKDVATNAYIKDSDMLTFYPTENISFALCEEDSAVEVFGITNSANKKHLILTFENGAETIEQVNIDTLSDGTFHRIATIPETELDTLNIAIYTGPKSFGDFTSWVYNVITIKKDEGGKWTFPQSPVYEHNLALYEKNRSVSEALKSTQSIQKDRASVRSVAEQITAGVESDYDKALALHDWVCSYVYYDTDNLQSEKTLPYSADDVIKSQKALCLGFATLYASLCRAVEIPCNVISGYALGVGEDTEWTDETIESDELQNHAWNEVYVDGRWIIVDTTWDTQNKIENGKKIKGKDVSHLYFDANMQFFSHTHKGMEYSRWR